MMHVRSELFLVGLFERYSLQILFKWHSRPNVARILIPVGSVSFLLCVTGVQAVVHCFAAFACDVAARAVIIVRVWVVVGKCCVLGQSISANIVNNVILRWDYSDDNVLVNELAARASDDELSQRFRSRSETPQRPVARSQGQGHQSQVQGQTGGGSEVDTSSYRHNLLGGGYCWSVHSCNIILRYCIIIHSSNNNCTLWNFYKNKILRYTWGIHLWCAIKASCRSGGWQSHQSAHVETLRPRTVLFVCLFIHQSASRNKRKHDFTRSSRRCCQVAGFCGGYSTREIIKLHSLKHL